MRFNIVFEDDEPTQVKVIHDGAVYQAPSTHPSFTAILGRLAANPDDQTVVTLFDPQAALNEVFRVVSPRVSVVNGVVLYDGDPLHNGVAKQILRFVEEQEMDRLTAVAAFTERVMRNPSENSRDQLFAWLDKFDFTITEDGKFVAYKAVYLDTDGVGVSSRPAPERDQVRVDGVLIVNEPVRNLPGSVVTMPRSLVADNPYDGCSTGLHCGTWEYAKQFLGWGSTGGHILEIHVDPVDVVSVPLDENTQKIRVCRYEVIDVIEDKYTRSILEAKTEPAVVDDEFVPFGEDVEWEPESTTVVDEDDFDPSQKFSEKRSYPGMNGVAVNLDFKIGDRVRTVKNLFSMDWQSVPLGTLGTVREEPDGRYVGIALDGYSGVGKWVMDRFEKVEVTDVTKVEKVDTRLNYTKQKRYPAGIYRNGKSVAGRFIPKDSSDYNQF